MEYSIGIYRNGSLIHGYITEPMHESCIDEHVAEKQAQYPDCTVDCVEYEEYYGQDD
jgi:hypothetical protein